MDNLALGPGILRVVVNPVNTPVCHKTKLLPYFSPQREIDKYISIMELKTPIKSFQN